MLTTYDEIGEVIDGILDVLRRRIARERGCAFEAVSRADAFGLLKALRSLATTLKQ